MPQTPSWNPPENIAKALAEGDGFWEDEQWSPILVTAMSGTEFDGREIAVAWQIEFDPSDDEFSTANAAIEEMGIEPDGYSWGDHIQNSIRKTNGALADRLHTSDCETGTCVIWVESAEDCRELLETTWKLIFQGED